MAVQRTITAASAVYSLGVAGLFPTPQVLQGYSADAAFETDAVEPVETMMGVDGRLSGGFVPRETMQTITLMADSPSVDLFEQWISAQETAREAYIAFATILLPATGRKYSMTRGFLTSGTKIPGTRKVLQPRAFRITWQNVTAANA